MGWENSIACVVMLKLRGIGMQIRLSFSQILLCLLLLVLLSSAVSASTFSIYVIEPDKMINSADIDFTIHTTEDTSCNLTILNEGLELILGEDSDEHTKTVKELDDGDYDTTIGCTYSGNSSIRKEKSFSFELDTSAPEILGYEPEVINDHSSKFIVETDKDSTCRYSMEEGKDFYDMGNIFSITGHKSHRTGLDFESDGAKDIYIRCEDEFGNRNTEDFRARVLVDVPPTARIALSKSSPLTAGTIEIDVITSEPLIGTPSLKYTLQDEDGRTETFNVPLSGNREHWEGFMIISSSGGRRVGSFEFEGRDYGGNLGTRITSGGTFVVDPEKPRSIDDFKATAIENARVRLQWEYDDHDEIEKYEIYRSTSSGVSRLDYHGYTEDKGYIDRDLRENTVYYYRIIPIDQAGNRGDLSREVDVRTGERDEPGDEDDSDDADTETSEPSEQSSPGLSSNLMPILEDSISQYDGLKKLTDDLVLYFRGRSGAEERIVEDFRILNMVNNAKSEVYRRIGELEDLKKEDLDESNLNNRIREIEIRLESVKSDIPTGINIREEYKIEREPTMRDILDSIDALLNLLRIVNLDPDIREDYADESLSINQNFRIQGTAEIIELDFYDGSTREYLLVDKEVSQEGDRILDEQGLMVVEDIHEDVTERVRDIEFLTGSPETLRQSATVKWDLEDINGRIKYFVEGDFGSFSEDLVKTTILDNFRLYFDEMGRETSEDDDSEALTGWVTVPMQGFGLLRDHAGLVLGILVLGGLGTYYLRMDSNQGMLESIRKKKTPKPHNKKKKETSRKKKTPKPHKKNKFHEIYEEMMASGEIVGMDEDPEKKYSEPDFQKERKSRKIIHDLEEEKSNLEQTPKKRFTKYKQKIKKANEMIDNLDFDGASGEYINLLEMLNKEKDAILKERTLEEMWQRLYRKIELYQNTIYLKDAMKNKDHDSMQRHMKAIIDDHNHLSEIDDENTKLMKQARTVHKKYMQFLNS